VRKISKVPKLVETVRNFKSEQVPESYRLSYSQLSTYLTCKHRWKLQYVDGLSSYSPSIHTLFGTALHETVQTWLTTLYNVSVKASNELDLAKLLEENLRAVFKKESKKDSTFTTADQLKEFYEDGIQILDYLRKKRASFFSTKRVYLVAVELPLYYQLKEGAHFKGFIDLVFYDEDLDKWLLIDIKTSTTGWNDYAKKDEVKISQLILYKVYFSKQFNIPVDSIEVEYFIVKRKVPADAEFANMLRRVQQFRPAAGSVKQKKVQQNVAEFLHEALDLTGKPQSKSFTKALTVNACKFCEFKKTEHCEESKLIN
jgi:CRISPR/Cas system-associated exonuclease Cas4 (RecB family)